MGRTVALVLLVLLALTEGNNETRLLDEVFSVYRLLPADQKQFQYVKDLYERADELDLNFWKSAKEAGGFFDVMVSDSKREQLLRRLRTSDVPFLQTIEDVESLIKKNEKKPKERRLFDDSGIPVYDFKSYGSYSQMVAWMKALARKYPDLAQFITIGKTNEGRSIDGLELGTRGPNKRIFWIDGGIHAREWAAPHTALFFIHELISRYHTSPEIKSLMDGLTFVIVPNVNPDGYEFTRSSTNPHIRLWRKNRSKMVCRKDSWGRNRCCRGVDLNRNFDFHYKESGTSDDPCSEIYPGSGVFSEPEARAIRDAILSKRYKGRIDGYVTLHTYSQIWIHSYGHKKDTYPGDIQELYDVGKRAARALQKVYGTKYIVGSGADTLYPASGGSEDWTKLVAKVKYVYLLELRPDEKNWDGFILDEKELIPTARETWEGMKVVAHAILQRSHTLTPTTTTSAQKFRFGDGSEGSCYDLRHACKRWVAEREDLCKSVPIFMRENCAYSCGYC